ncbi:MAG: hypothetical protein QOH67_1435 [Hyphomicrobiales bacterium]|nr:hypothetical protein [Hyphomicrobiales bacterium]
MLRATIADLKSRHAAFDAWVNRHWATLSPLGYLLALAVSFGAAGLAAYHSGFGPIAAAVCGLLFILFIRFYARSVPAMQRLIGRLHPEPDDATRPDQIPGWAGGVYLLAGFIIAVAFSALQESYTYAPVELFLGWGAGRNLLDLFWRKRDGTRAFDTFDQKLDEWAAEYRGSLRALGTSLCFALLSGGVALHAYESGLADVAAAACGAQCRGIPGIVYLAAAAFGAGAILFVALYAWLTSSVQRVTADPWKFVRPEPPSTKVPFWVRALHVLIGIAVFIAMAALGQPHVSGEFAISFGDYGGLALIAGWWIGGRGVLAYFWAKLPRGGAFAAARD